MGTRLISNPTARTSSEQTTLPFGAALNAESTRTNNNKRFTSYDRSAATGLDYAVNRTYDSAQGRFTQVDPIGIQASSPLDPQSLNLYAYCGNDPVNHTDPDGLFFKKLFNFFKKAFQWIAVALVVAVAVLVIINAPFLFANTLQAVLGIIGAVANATSSVLNALGLPRAGAIFGIIAAGASFGTSILAARAATNWKTILSAVSSGATAASRTLSAFGHRKVGQIFGLVASTTAFISGGLNAKEEKDKYDNVTGYDYSFKRSAFQVFKFARSTAQQVATISGATRAAGILDTLGLVDDFGDIIEGIDNFNDDKKIREEDLTRKAFRWGKELIGVDRDQANRQTRLQSRVMRLGGLVGNVNNIVGRFERQAAR